MNNIMKFRDLIDETTQYLLANKTKTILTMVGITIGIMSIIAMLSIGNAAKKSLEKDIQSMGANVVRVFPNQEFTRSGKQKVDLFTKNDVNEILKISGVKNIYTLDSGSYGVYYKKNKQMLTLMGSDVEFHSEMKSEIDTGRDYTQSEFDNYSKVIVIGPGIAKDMFGKKNPIGETLKIGGTSFKIIGVNKSLTFAFGLANFDNMIFIPTTTMHRYLLGREESSFMWVTLNDDADSESISDKIYNTLTKSRGLKADSKIKYFSLTSSKDSMKMIGTITNIFTILLASIAGISLVVAGIGIMNMMLTTVMERTKEIGLRKAVGAQAKDISKQFLVESVAITLMGGLFGVLFGILLSNIVTGVFMKIDSGVDIQYIIFAFGVCTFIGVCFGYYPAKRAAKLNPIEALRYE